MRVKDELRLSDGKLPAYAWPGGYPLFYLTNQSECLCPTCVNEPNTDWLIDAYDINYEDESLFCDNCSQKIESAYGDE